EQALELDPHNASAKGGLVLVDKMKDGKKTRQQMLKELRLDAAKRELVRLHKGKRKLVVLDEADEKENARQDKEDQARDPLDEIKRRRRIAEQQATATVNEAVRQANRVVRSNPGDAYRILEQTLADVKGNPDLTAESVRNLEARLTSNMRTLRR